MPWAEYCPRRLGVAWPASARGRRTPGLRAHRAHADHPPGPLAPAAPDRYRRCRGAPRRRFPHRQPRRGGLPALHRGRSDGFDADRSGCRGTCLSHHPVLRSRRGGRARPARVSRDPDPCPRSGGHARRHDRHRLPAHDRGARAGARRRPKELAKRLNLPPEEVGQALHRLRTLDPEPGLRFASEPSEAIVPDVIVGKWDTITRCS